LDELEMLAATLNRLCVDPQAVMRYDLLAGGLVWSDETPQWKFDGLADNEFPPGHALLRALLNYRSSLILGESRERFRVLWERAIKLCPNWPGFLPSRQDASLIGEYKRRAETSQRSWEEADARFELQRQPRSNKAIA
jgi:hypothetical protein